MGSERVSVAATRGSVAEHLAIAHWLRISSGVFQQQDPSACPDLCVHKDGEYQGVEVKRVFEFTCNGGKDKYWRATISRDKGWYKDKKVDLFHFVRVEDNTHWVVPAELVIGKASVNIEKINGEARAGSLPLSKYRSDYV